MAKVSDKDDANLILSLIDLEKEPPSYAEVSLEETPLTTTNRSLSGSSRHSNTSIPHETSTQQILANSKVDDNNSPIPK